MLLDCPRRPLFATDSSPEAIVTSTPSPATTAAAAKQAAVWLKDVHDFNDQMQRTAIGLVDPGTLMAIQP
jgi:hypothetical protein